MLRRSWPIKNFIWVVNFAVIFVLSIRRASRLAGIWVAESVGKGRRAVIPVLTLLQILLSHMVV